MACQRNLWQEQQDEQGKQHQHSTCAEDAGALLVLLGLIVLWFLPEIPLAGHKSD